jgi:CHAT domain-containing protein
MAIRQIKYIFPNLSEAEQIQFYQRTKEDFERFNAVAFQSSKQHPELLKDVFNNQVILKSILFFTQQHRLALINQRRDSLLIQQHDQLRSKREQLGRFYQLTLKDLATAETSATVLEKEIDQLEKAISLMTSETVSEKMMEREIKWDEIQKSMTSEQALIELIRFRKYDLKTFVENNTDRVRFGFADSALYAALITSSETVNAPQLVLLRDGNNMETRFLSYYRNTLTYYVEDKNSYVSYWKPFEQYLTNKKNVYLSGDGVYHRLNLNTLRQPETGEYLLQRYDIHYLLNPGQFVQEKTATTSAKKAVLIGNPYFDASIENISEFDKFQPLPGSEKEVARINDVLKTQGWTTRLLLQKAATEKSVKEVRSPDLLHIATHGFFSVDKVKLNEEAKKDFLFYSGLVFAGANKNIAEEKGLSEDDGILTAFEVMNLDLSSTDLVVLSACETGLGKIENGEGVYGLQRSFLQAGARNIMISLWKVDDTLTQELMVQFYKNVFKGQSVRAALKQAQLDQVKKGHNPFGWGGFVVVGFN